MATETVERPDTMARNAAIQYAELAFGYLRIYGLAPEPESVAAVEACRRFLAGEIGGVELATAREAAEVACVRIGEAELCDRPWRYLELDVAELAVLCASLEPCYPEEAFHAYQHVLLRLPDLSHLDPRHDEITARFWLGMGEKARELLEEIRRERAA